MMDAVIQEVEAAKLVWRVSSAGYLAEGTRSEALVKRPGDRAWTMGYGETVEAALKDALTKWRETPV